MAKKSLYNQASEVARLHFKLFDWNRGKDIQLGTFIVNLADLTQQPLEQHPMNLTDPKRGGSQVTGTNGAPTHAVVSMRWSPSSGPPATVPCLCTQCGITVDFQTTDPNKCARLFRIIRFLLLFPFLIPGTLLIIIFPGTLIACCGPATPLTFYYFLWDIAAFLCQLAGSINCLEELCCNCARGRAFRHIHGTEEGRDLFRRNSGKVFDFVYKLHGCNHCKRRHAIVQTPQAPPASLGSHGTLVAVSAPLLMPLRDSGHSNECSLYVL
jgi:hypothetical protein